MSRALTPLDYPAMNLAPQTPAQRDGVEVRFEAYTVTKVPLRNFGPDISIPATTDQTIDTTAYLGEKCTGFTLISALAYVSINGGGFRTMAGAVVIDDSIITTIRVSTPGTNGAIIQLHGV